MFCRAGHAARTAAARGGPSVASAVQRRVLHSCPVVGLPLPLRVVARAVRPVPARARRPGRSERTCAVHARSSRLRFRLDRVVIPGYGLISSSEVPAPVATVLRFSARIGSGQGAQLRAHDTSTTYRRSLLHIVLLLVIPRGVYSKIYVSVSVSYPISCMRCLAAIRSDRITSRRETPASSVLLLTN